MKRGKPLRRKTPLRRGSSSLRSSPLRPRSEKGAARAARRREIAARLGPVAQCLRCGRAPDDLHHRKPRGRGGSEDERNLLPLDRSCHDEVHRDPRRSRAEGWLLGSDDDEGQPLPDTPWVRRWLRS